MKLNHSKVLPTRMTNLRDILAIPAIDVAVCRELVAKIRLREETSPASDLESSINLINRELFAHQ